MNVDLKDFHKIALILCIKFGPDFRRVYFGSKELDIRKEIVERNRKIAMRKLERNKYTQWTVDGVRKFLELSREARNGGDRKIAR